MNIGDVVLVSFPFVEQPAFKKRPAVVLLKAGERVVCAAVTSRADKRPWEVELKHWKEAGLSKPSRVKVDTLSTFSASSGARRCGRLHPSDLRRVEAAYRKVLELGGVAV